MQTIRVIALSVLAGATLAVGATAAIAFPTMKALDPTLATFANWPDPHWPIAAGDVANRLFRMLDWLALGVGAIALVSLVPKGSRPRGIAGAVCVLAIMGLVGIVAAEWLWLRPTMHEHLQAYWSAARAGDVAVGRAERDAFDRVHPITSAMLTAQLCLALLGAALSRPPRPHPSQ